jgi:hypothetical protein
MSDTIVPIDDEKACFEKKHFDYYKNLRGLEYDEKWTYDQWMIALNEYSGG